VEENSFKFDASTLMDGFFPMPKTLSPGAAQLLNRFLWQAFEASSRFEVLDLRLKCQTDEQLEQAAYEVLRTRFPMPCEGCDSMVETIDSVSLYPDSVLFRVNRLFAAYVVSTVQIPKALLRAKGCAAPKLLPLDESDLADLVEALQARHRERTAMWNEHAIYAVKNDQPIQPPEAFGLVRLASILNKLGASTAP